MCHRDWLFWRRPCDDSCFEKRCRCLRLVRIRLEFPHVLNRIATAWDDPLKMLVLMQALIEGDRPKSSALTMRRRGFMRNAC